ncbi:MAG: hypothetical protein Q4C02_08625 [Eubacteriales bacterium]|nr:hypothetical protein [Eubacteriales bacterium]
MKNLKKWITSPAATLVLFAAAAVLLLFSTIGGARAAFIAYSETYQGHVEMYDIGVSLLEKSAQDKEARVVAFRNYIQNSEDDWEETPTSDHIGVLLAPDHLLAEGEEFVPGKEYQEEISVANTGTIDEYVRVTLYKYWRDENGNKVVPYGTDVRPNDLPAGMAMAAKAGDMTTYGLTPDLIKFTFPNLGSDWLLDEKNSAVTEERQVYYYNKLLPSGQDTAEVPLTGTLTVDPSITLKVTQTTSEDGKTITTSYDYDGWQFCIEATVDAVQDHNAVDAIKSAWGRDVSIAQDGTLQLK